MLFFCLSFLQFRLSLGFIDYKTKQKIMNQRVKLLFVWTRNIVCKFFHSFIRKSLYKIKKKHQRINLLFKKFWILEYLKRLDTNSWISFLLLLEKKNMNKKYNTLIGLTGSSIRFWAYFSIGSFPSILFGTNIRRCNLHI